MEPHPIPQNVTSFQFKLIGDMTLKQFGYLAAGCGIAYFLFVFLARDYPLVIYPLAIIFALLGIAFAFLPIGSRPLDHWLAAFLKAVYSPTKRVWRKNGKNFQEDPLFTSRLVTYLTGSQKIPTPQPKPAVVSPPPPEITQPAPLPSQQELQETVDLARQAQNLQMQIIQQERNLSQIKIQTQQPTVIPVDYSQQVNKILSDLKNLIDQASKIKQQIEIVQSPEGKPPVPAPPAALREKVKVVIPPRPKQAQVALTIFPNVINGIIKDKENNYLEGVVAVIYDKEGLPVRALKTNKLGQFSGATPLPNGTYTLELEKDSFSFDVLQIELSGEVLPPLTITAK